ncbi:MAG TPA: efflux RND transporter permease subunit [Chthoniobacterales bacterium]|jgi:CzcA family heavy metal efflux pump|nr:efflux RND transporter permease subunit [Chthoniobacterales bacterium]
MWIVRLALQRPYTFIVLALLILIVSPVVIFKTPTDIFPNINIPVISVIWDYEGLSADEMANRISGNYERVLTTTVNDIEHIESQSFRGRGVVKIFFHQGANLELALSQVTAVSQTMLRNLPQGTQPPLVITYNASSVPVLQLGLGSASMSEQQINDAAMNFVRTRLVTIPGAGVPYPYGGKMRQVMVDIDVDKLRSKGLSPQDVVDAISAQNLILPGGTAKIGATEYDVSMNGSTQTVEELNALPIKQVGGSVITIGDVAHVRDGFKDQTNIVRENGSRAVLLSIIKTGSTSTLDIVNGVLNMLPSIRTQVPPELKITPLFDQSVFVRAAISGVLKEALIAACLTAAMILLFLADWRATLIIAVSIPLSILCSICMLSALGETINLMTLSGLALAVGILVDDATVTIENIDRHLEEGLPLKDAILEGAHQIAVPAFVSTLCICIVFVPMFLLSGVARYLFVPLAESVVFAMLASYFWSRTLVPTLAMYLLRDHETKSKAAAPRGIVGVFSRVQKGFERGFDRFKAGYDQRLRSALEHPGRFVTIFLVLCLGSLVIYPFLGQDFFPSVDAGQIRLHVRAKTGTRIEEMARLCDEVEKKIRTIIPAKELEGVLDNIGVPYSGINTSYANNGTFGPADGEILMSLNEGHAPTAKYVETLRRELPKAFPGVSFFFQPADIVSQILNFGIPSPIDVQITGRNLAKNFEIAAKLQSQMKQIPGIADVHLQQALDQPRLDVKVDRTKSTQLGFTHRDVANSLLVSLSGSGQVTPTFWLSPVNGVVYNLMSKVPQYHVESLQDLKNLPIQSEGTQGKVPQLLANIATIQRGTGSGVVSHYNVMPTLDIYATTQGRPLGSVAADIRKVVAAIEKDLPRGSAIVVRGQVETMQTSFFGLGVGVLGAVILVYLLIVVNFQSWSDPFIIITALPGALAGIAWLLFLTGTTLSVPSLMGAVMCIGVATANAILVISFAKEIYEKDGSGIEAAHQAGVARLRPVLMTALAMIIGMIPMALGLGEGGEQNAPLARAVIGGLLFATVSTLLFVPVVFSLFRRKSSAKTSPDKPTHDRTSTSGSFHAHGAA